MTKSLVLVLLVIISMNSYSESKKETKQITEAKIENPIIEMMSNFRNENNSIF